jgi:hypothetical protein
VFERAKTVHVLDRAATVIGSHVVLLLEITLYNAALHTLHKERINKYVKKQMTGETKGYGSLKQNLKKRMRENMNAKNKDEDFEKRFYAETQSLTKIGQNLALRKEVRGKQARSEKGEQQEDNMSEFEKYKGDGVCFSFHDCRHMNIIMFTAWI